LIGIEICLGVPLQSVQLFLPVIIKRLGYNTVKVCLTSFREQIFANPQSDDQTSRQTSTLSPQTFPGQ
jgi:hypothetical protein